MLLDAHDISLTNMDSEGQQLLVCIGASEIRQALATTKPRSFGNQGSALQCKEFDAVPSTVVVTRSVRSLLAWASLCHTWLALEGS